MLDARRVRTAVLVSGGGTNLQAMMDSIDEGRVRHAELVLVASDRADAYALERAGNRGIDTAVFSSERELDGLLRKRAVELIVLAGFLKILSADFIRSWENRIINIHPALIPSFCGRGCYGIHVHEKALARGVKVTGATVHFVNEVPDGGPIIQQKAVTVRDGDTPETLQKRVMEEAEWVILPQCLEEVAVRILKGEL